MKLVRLIKMCFNETYIEVRIDKYLSNPFHVQNGLKQGDALSPLLFSLPLEYTYAIRKVQENQVGLKSNGTHQLLVYADNVNLLGGNIDTIKKNTETLIDLSKGVGLKVNTEKTKCMLLFRHQNAGQNHDIKIADRFFENVPLLKYFGTTVTYKNLIQEKIKKKMNSGNAFYHSVQNLLSSRLLSKNVKIRIHKTINVPVVLYGCETWSLTLREEHRLRVFQNGMMRKMFGPKRDEVKRNFEKTT
jgi:hypothetical protein